MLVKHLQEYLGEFTDGKKGNAISNARVYMKSEGYYEEIKRIDVEESNIIGDGSIRVVFKPNKRQLIRAPDIPE